MILPALVKHWAEYPRDDFEDRAAIIQEACGVSRGEAEKRAEAIVRAKYGKLAAGSVAR